MNKLLTLLEQGAVPVENKEELQELLTQTIFSLNGGAVEDAAQIAIEIITNSTEYISGDYEFKHVNMWQHPYSDDVMIAVLMSTHEDTEPYDILSENGVFGYVYNLDAPYCSELGYSYYRQDGAYIKRIG